MHNNIKSFLATVSLQSEFSVNVGNIPTLENVNCAVRFLFMEIGAPNVRGVIYLPDVMPSTDLKTGCKLIYVFMNPAFPEVSFTTSKPAVIDTWLQFSGAVPVLRDKLLQDAANEDLTYREEFEDGRFLELTKNNELIFDGTTFQISKTSRLRISEIGKPPAIGVEERGKPDSLVWISIPNFRSLCVWYLTLVCVIDRCSKEEEKAEELAIEVADIEVVEMPKKPRKIETSIKKPRYQAGAVFIEHPRVSRKLSVDQESMKKCEDEIIQISISLADILETIDTSNFARPEIEPEPELATPELPVKEEVNYPVNETPQAMEMDMDQLKRETYERLSDVSRVNWEYFNPDYQPMEVSIPIIEYNKKSGLSFEETFERALPVQACILTAALLVNGSDKMNSISRVFGLEKRQTKLLEAFAIIDKFGSQIFDKIIELREKIEQCYLPAAIIRDFALMKRFSLMHKRFEKPRDLGDSLPFQFSLRPLTSFDHWFADCLHKARIGADDTQSMVTGVAHRLHELFTSYMTPGKQLNEFMREITVGSGIVLGPWMVFMTPFSDFMTTWVEFWTKSFKEEKLVVHFIEALKHSSLIMKYYLPCAPIRDPEAIEKVARQLKFFESLGLAADFVVKPSETTSLASLMAKTAEFVGFGKK